MPLSERALAIVEAQRERAFCGHVFPSPLRGSVTIDDADTERADETKRRSKGNGRGSPIQTGDHAVLAFTYPGAPLSDMTLSAVLRRMGVAAVPHGFRSTFRDWAAEQTDYPREVAEMALAHSIGNKVEAAYRRGDLFDKRKQLMQDWAEFAITETAPKAEGGKVE